MLTTTTKNTELNGMLIGAACSRKFVNLSEDESGPKAVIIDHFEEELTEIKVITGKNDDVLEKFTLSPEEAEHESSVIDCLKEKYCK